MRKLFISFFIFILVSVMLCSCNKFQENVLNSSTASKAINRSATANQTNFKQTESFDFNEKVQKYSVKLSLLKNNCEKVELLGFNKKYYFFYATDNQYTYYFTIDRKSGSYKIIYKLSNTNDNFFQKEYGGTLLIGYGDSGSYKIYHLHLISVTTDCKKKYLLKCDTNGFPACSLNGHYVIVNYVDSNITSKGGTVEKGESKIMAFDLKNETKKEIITTNFKRDLPIYTGTILPYSQGWSNGSGFCYEKVDLANESYEKDDSGKCSVYYYSFKDGTSKKLNDIPHKVLYICGDENCFITSDDFIKSNVTSGRITLNENGTYNSYKIPGIFSGKDVIDSFKLSNKCVLVYNDSHFLIYNLANKTYYMQKFKYSAPDNYNALNIQAYGDEFAYTQPNKNNIIIHLFTLKKDS